MLLKDLLQKPQKTLEDAYAIYSRLQELFFFKDFFDRNLKTFDTESVLSLCQNIEYEHVFAGETVFEAGDTADKFYAILSGKVSISVPITKPGSQTTRNLGSKPILKRSKTRELTTFSDAMLLDRLSTLKDGDETGTLNTEAREKEEPPTTKSKRMLKKSNTTNFGLVLENFDQLEIKQEEPAPLMPLTTREVPQYQANNSRENGVYDDLSDNKKAKKYDPKHNSYVCYMDEGESFGELALNCDTTRSATVVCDTDCEFLIISKRQFDVLKMRRERTKEDFLKTVFPSLCAEVISPVNFNYVLSSFNTEAYRKGTYLTVEGKTNEAEAKIFVIYKGECRVERNLSIEINNSHDSSRSFMYSNTVPIQIAVVGKGMIVGEEVLTTKDEYSYSVKAISETVLVHVVTRKNFKSRSFHMFNDNLTAMFEKKKKQREGIFNQRKKEYEAKMEQQKEASSPRQLDSPELKSMISKSSLLAFFRLENREQKSTILNDSPIRTHTKSFKICPVKSESNLLNRRVNNPSMSYKTDFINKEMPIAIEKRRIVKVFESTDPKQKVVDSKIQFLSKMPDIPKKVVTINDPDSLKLFGNPKSEKGRNKRIGKGQSLDLSGLDSNRLLIQTRSAHEPVDFVLSELAKGVKKFQMLNQDLVDVKGVQYSDDRGYSLERSPRLQITSFNESPILAAKRSLAEDTQKRMPKRIIGIKSQRAARVGPLPLPNKIISPTEKQFIVKGTGETPRGNSARELNSFLGYRNSIGELRLPPSAEETERHRPKTQRTRSKVKSEIPINTLSIDFENEKNMMSKSPDEKSARMGTTESPTSKILLTNNTIVPPISARLHGNNGLYPNQMFNVKEWRMKVFKKAPKVRVGGNQLEKAVFKNTSEPVKKRWI